MQLLFEMVVGFLHRNPAVSLKEVTLLRLPIPEMGFAP